MGALPGQGAELPALRHGRSTHSRPAARARRHLDFFQFEAWLHADVPRVACAGCAKTSQVGVPWAREGSGLTALFEALALAPRRELPVKQAAALLGQEADEKWTAAVNL